MPSRLPEELGSRRVLATLLVAAAVASCGGPSTATPLLSPTAPAGVAGSPSADSVSTPRAWRTHISERFGYMLSLPPDWIYTPATADWPVGEYATADAPYTDQFNKPPLQFPVVDIVTQPLPDGMTEAAFLDWLDTENARFCTVEEDGETTIDGEDARLQRQTCGYNAWEAAVFHDGRVYLVYWLGRPALLAEERPIMEEVLASFRFP